MLNLKSLTLAAAFGVGLVTTAFSAEPASQWGHWRGPVGRGVSETATPPVEFSTTKNVAWKVAIPGRGSGSPVIWDNKVFVVTAENAGSGNSSDLNFQVLCFDRNSGTQLWKQTAIVATPQQQTHATNSWASASPCTDGSHVYAHFGSHGLYCYDMLGNPVWQRNDFGQMLTRNGFGEGSSPTLVDDMIIVPWDHEGPSALYALNKLTGETIWKTPRDEPTCWATPMIVATPSGKQIVMNGENYARSYDLQSGKELWRCSGQTQRPAASAVVGEDMVYVGSGFRGSFLAAFRLTGSGDIKGSPSVAWTQDRNTPDVASPLLVGNRLYYFSARRGILSCVAADTGRVIYSQQRVDGLGEIYASPVAAGGHIYLSDRSGNVVVIKDSDTFEIVATNSLGDTIDASPAPAGNQLFVRTASTLYCLAE